MSLVLIDVSLVDGFGSLVEHALGSLVLRLGLAPFTAIAIVAIVAIVALASATPRERGVRTLVLRVTTRPQAHKAVATSCCM